MSDAGLAISLACAGVVFGFVVMSAAAWAVASKTAEPPPLPRVHIYWCQGALAYGGIIVGYIGLPCQYRTNTPRDV